jgi:hypothetical protein
MNNGVVCVLVEIDAENQVVRYLNKKRSEQKSNKLKTEICEKGEGGGTGELKSKYKKTTRKKIE